jgi:pyruvate,water dikinase
MVTAGIPVPDGFVVLTEAFEKFLAETDLKQEISGELEKVEQSKIHTVEYASKKIQGLILGAVMPEDIKEET